MDGGVQRREGGLLWLFLDTSPWVQGGLNGVPLKIHVHLGTSDCDLILEMESLQTELFIYFF